MSADLNTEIVIKGNTEELYSLIKVIKSFETEKLEQYRKKGDCGYLEFCDIHAGGSKTDLDDLSDEEIRSFISNADGKISIFAAGPYGSFGELGEVGLFEEMASAAPSAYFKGISSGFVTGADVSLKGELKDGVLYLTEYYMPDDELPELYTEAINKILPYLKFCSIFNVDKDSFDYGCYCGFILEEGFPDVDYDTFMKYCETSEMDKEKYEIAIEKVRSLGLFDYDSFINELDTDEYSTHTTYDPISKKYTKIK